MRFFVSLACRYRWLLPITLGVLTLPFAARAQSFGDRVLSGVDNASEPTGLREAGNLETITGNIIEVFLSVVGVLLLLILIYAGFLWMTAGGNTDQVKKARTMVINAIVGLVIVFAAYAITEFVIRSLVNTTSGAGGANAGPQ